jgi:phthiocerol/phenolphthiocerol synthesis type-I polyketide synthase D
MDFGISFFSCAAQQIQEDRYHLLKEAARFADSHDFCAIWTPERHFHNFGGLFPNPAVLSAALAMITERIQIRAGSLISPLHNPIRIAEDWSVVDNLSRGRVAVSFGSGWNIDDFVFFPERYADRHAIMYEQIRIVKDLWEGKTIEQTNSARKQTPIRIFPRPIQPTLPVWVTSSGNVDTFISAGNIGANVLTHLLGQDIPTLAGKIAAYRLARENNNYDPSSGKVSLMLHTFIGRDMNAVRELVREPFREYLRSALAIEQSAAVGGGVISGGHQINAEEISQKDSEALLDLAFERYVHSSALIGTSDSCAELVATLEAIGVDEIACLIDFGPPTEQVLRSLEYLNEVRALCATSGLSSDKSLQEFIAEF